LFGGESFLFIFLIEGNHSQTDSSSHFALETTSMVLKSGKTSIVIGFYSTDARGGPEKISLTSLEA